MLATSKHSAILNRAVDPNRLDMTQDAARFLLGLDFADQDHDRMAELSEKANQGFLSEDEGEELDTYIFLSDFFTLVQSKARQALKRQETRS